MSGLQVVAVGAHPDDIELGCGGALLAHRRAGDQVTLLVMTDGAIGPQGTNSRREEQVEAARLLGAELVWGGFRDGAVPDGVEAVSRIQDLIDEVGADIVYTHSLHDTHQDHRATARATFAAARRVSRVLSYEAPSSVDFTPVVYLDIDGLVEAKLELVRAHLSQVLGCGLVDLDAVEAQARYRGFQARGRMAEAFEVHRFLWSPGESGGALAESSLSGTTSAIGDVSAVDGALPAAVPAPARP